MARRECVKSAVFDGFGSCAEIGGGFYVPNGYGEMESDELVLFWFSFWDEECY